MPASLRPGHPIEHFAQDLDKLLDHYTAILEPADVALVLASNLTPLVAAHCEPQIVDSLKLHYDVAMKLRMAKAALDDGPKVGGS